MKNKDFECKIFKIQLFQIESDVTASSSMSDDVSNRINKIGSRADLMKQPFKIYENLRSAVSVYRGHGSSSRSGVYQVSGHYQWQVLTYTLGLRLLKH